MPQNVRRFDGLDRPERTLSDRAYQRLRQDIIGGQLSAGSKLKLERLVGDYGIGMSPLREALARLVGDFLVVSEGQRGFWVAPLSVREFQDAVALGTLVETEALSRSIQLGDAEWEASVRRAYEDLAHIERQFPEEEGPLPPKLAEEWEVRDHAFHATLISACGSEWLLRTRDLIYQHCMRYRQIAVPGYPTRRSIHEEHAALFQAAMQRNVLKASRMLEAHVTATEEEVRKAIVDNPELLIR